jgi:peptide/nickel transport system permease protein
MRMTTTEPRSASGAGQRPRPGVAGAARNVVATPRRRRRPSIAERFARNRLALLGTVLLALLAVAATLAPLVAPYGRDEVSYNLLAPPSAAHLLGTDDVGRDVLTRLLFGAQTSLEIGLFAALAAVALGTVVGAIGGYAGGATDRLVTAAIDLMLSFPLLPLALVVAAFVIVTPPVLVLLVGLLSWMPVARLVRAEVLALKERDFVLAARALGGSDCRLILRHIVPNALAPVIVSGTLLVASAILLEAALSYLGYGVRPPVPSLGNMLQNAQQYIYTAPWIAVFPGAAISLIVTSVNLIGDGLRDALDPRLDVRL